VGNGAFCRLFQVGNGMLLLAFVGYWFTGLNWFIKLPWNWFTSLSAYV
jgi:hypothetical protein